MLPAGILHNEKLNKTQNLQTPVTECNSSHPQNDLLWRSYPWSRSMPTYHLRKNQSSTAFPIDWFRNGRGLTMIAGWSRSEICFTLLNSSDEIINQMYWVIFPSDNGCSEHTSRDGTELIITGRNRYEIGPGQVGGTRTRFVHGSCLS